MKENLNECCSTGQKLFASASSKGQVDVRKGNRWIVQIFRVQICVSVKFPGVNYYSSMTCSLHLRAKACQQT